MTLLNEFHNNTHTYWVAPCPLSINVGTPGGFSFCLKLKNWYLQNVYVGNAKFSAVFSVRNGAVSLFCISVAESSTTCVP